MYTQTKENICFQCGKERIIVKIYKEYINNSLVTTTQSICSDPKCQARTERELEKEKIRRETSLADKLYNAKNRYSYRKIEK